MKILFVDDEENIRELFQEYFQDEHEVFLADNGQSALELAVNENFDLIISDISLPKLNGVQFIKKLRFEGNHTPFIVITGDSDIQLAIEVFRLGAVDFFLKPFRMDSLKLRIKKYENAEIDFSSLFKNGEVACFHCEMNIEIVPKIKNINRYVALIIQYLHAKQDINEDDVLAIKVVLYELLANAIEHGSAGISYIQKQEILESNADYFEIVDNLCRELDRKIFLYFKLETDRIIIKITDQGNGFELSKIPSPIDDPRGNLLNGRGIFLVRMNIDSIEYNQLGNEVTVIKNWTH